ncbi:hypothetical protein A3C37_02705 [Candidatus Peribacteria bacterium RIFCSPHIGHO2_02_FULL_53_20]|nr:MAG: hypothetical protein A3C37_02705 [Candidatus Peribacteria bacterium RIFCSPHIGHO2_02_FULL_53_20]
MFLGFGHSLVHDFAPIDDTLLVRENLAIRGLSWENLRYVFTHFDPELYIPLTFVSFQINYVLGGLSPFGFHLGNVMLHVANAYLVFLMLQTFLKDRSGKSRFSSTGVAAFAGALIFALHPLHAEAVVWIAGRKDLLFTFFYLLTLVLYLRGREGAHRNAWYWGSVLCGLLALLSKATAMTLPVILLLVDWFASVAESRDSPLRRRLLFINKIPFFILSFLFAFIALSGKERIVGSSSMLDTGLVAIRSFGHYLWQFFVPIGFSVFYQQRDPITLLDPYFAVPLIVILILSAVSWYFRRSKPWIAFGFLFYLTTLSPTFFNFHKGLISFYAVDRYAYLPSIGVIFVVMMLLQHFLKKIPPTIKSQIHLNSPAFAQATVGRQFSILNFLSLIFIIVPLVVLSRHQTRIWDTPESLYAHAVAVDPASVPARATLAQALRQMNRNSEAFAILKEGLTYGDDVSYHLEAGNIYAANGQVGDAITEFTKASKMKPDLPEPIFSIGNLEEHRGNIDLALEYYSKALALDPSYVGARVRIADILIDRGELAEAEEQLVEALRWNESYFGANVQMYRLRMKQGREEEAKMYLERAKALRPGEAIDPLTP